MQIFNQKHSSLYQKQMERFKVVERETKTKAYSKEGLGAAQKLDPAQKERDETAGWLATSIDALNLKLDQFECEIESLLAGKKKRLDKDKQDRVEDLKSKVEKHRYHIRKLETLLRMLDNMSVEVSQIRRIKDDIEYYIESSQDPDFEENEYIYDDIIGLDEIELSGVGLPSSATTDSNNSNDTGGTPTSTTSGNSPVPSPPLNALHNHSSDSSNEDKKKTKDDLPAKPVKPTAVRVSNSNSLISSSNCSQVALKPVLNSSTPSKPVSGSVSHSTPNNSSPSSGLSNHIVGNFAAVAAANTQPNTTSSKNTSHSSENGSLPSSTASLQQQQQPPSLLQLTTSPPHVTSVSSASSAPASASLHHQQSSSTSVSVAVALVHHHHQPSSGTHGQTQSTTHHQQPTPRDGGNVTTGSQLVSALSQQTAKQQQCLVNSMDHHQHNSSSPPSSVSSAPSPLPTAGTTTPSPAQQQQPPQPTHQGSILPTLNGPITSKVPEGMSSLKVIAQQVIDRAGLEIPPSEPARGLFDSKLQQQQQQSVTSEAHIPPLLGVAPLGPVPLQKEHQCQFQMMEAAFYHMPHPSDSERLRTYLPRNPVPTPLYYHQVPLPHSDTVEFFQRLSTETLFFIFYYMEGTKAQYLAAKALKKQSWRFHTKYMMWFQRHEEPKIINEEYEQGTYIYFDYEKWGQRKKEGFMFEYKYLEDRDLN
ncbi:CCR4-NOT transcription complex subunit 3 isoform X2 [Zootermopsis nevadensis]|uniref:CCR4-NOT transcription complex subunit 3 isoform X2 n=1 Tax=Zootermopsis nevadensis TaxID=136037 RepID=UPI000B8EE319|nr:CCR4-NOT transcription complex subunit 3 isoform X2 [Zootermopsis nevadensis]